MGGLKAQDTVSPWKVEGLGANKKSTIKYDLKSGEIRASNGVRIKYKDGKPEAAELTANNATINQKNGSAVASGNVVLRRDGLIWKSERIEYNFRTKNIKAAQFVSGNLETFIKGEGMIGNKTNGVYRAQNTIFTTEDSKDPSLEVQSFTY